VRATRSRLSLRQRLQQLFILQQIPDDPDMAARRMQHQPAGMHRRWGDDIDLAWKTTRTILEAADIPPLITGDLEGGGAAPHYCAALPNAMGTAAMNDLEMSREVARVMAVESKAMGFNWTFAPVVDIAQDPHSAIVGTRSYGSDVDAIIGQSQAYAGVFQSHGIAATAKHWPGEGYDHRDQHLVTTVNPLGWDQWNATFGRIYRSMIGQGVMSIMAGHIAWPAGARHLDPDTGRDAWQPATVSATLNVRLLREELGFNGVLVSDATSMGGFSSWAPRQELIPALLASGCDVLLFSKDADSDLRFLEQAVDDGRLTLARIDEALTRVLGLKAALNLHRLSIDERLAPLEKLKALLGNTEHQRTGRQAAAKAATRVKDNGNLPLSVSSHRRIVIASVGVETVWNVPDPASFGTLLEGLAERGFEVRMYDVDHPPTPADTDLILYLLAKESMMCHSHIEIDWARLHGGVRNGMRRHWHEIPTVMVSFGHPSYLLDAPRVPTYINAYYATEPMQQAVLSRLLGEEEFVGASPLDAFCGQEEAHW
jgi:beta-N-acetylhexosaminidase